jgi:hypothetical protein
MQNDGPLSGPTGPITAPLDAAKLESLRNRGAGWFSAIAAFSVINMLVLAFGGGVNFLIGLGVTQVIDVLCKLQAQRMPMPAAITLQVVGGAITVCIAGMFLLLGVSARRGHLWAFIVGMALYAIDGLIFLCFEDWWSLGFHAFALFMLSGGLSMQAKLNRLRNTVQESPVIDQAVN